MVVGQVSGQGRTALRGRPECRTTVESLTKPQSFISAHHLKGNINELYSCRSLLKIYKSNIHLSNRSQPQDCGPQIF
jgi:hypothetical protein